MKKVPLWREGLCLQTFCRLTQWRTFIHRAIRYYSDAELSCELMCLGGNPFTSNQRNRYDPHLCEGLRTSGSSLYVAWTDAPVDINHEVYFLSIFLPASRKITSARGKSPASSLVSKPCPLSRLSMC